MTAAIAKAITYSQNLTMEVTARSTDSTSGDPVVLKLYDSRKNKLNHLVMVLSHLYCHSNTPEGLCYEAMIKKNWIHPTSSKVDNYLINISDGEPGGCNSYSGDVAHRHTRQQIDKINQVLNIKVLSYFVESYSNNNTPSANFIKMYGSAAKKVNSNNMIEIANTINKMFMSSKA